MNTKKTQPVKRKMTALARAVQMSPAQKKRFEIGLQGMVDNLNRNVMKELEESKK